MPKYYEFEVALQDIQPRIWRRFLLRTTVNFTELHKAIQESFGWEQYHLWEFRLPTFEGMPIAGLPGGEEFDRPTPDAKTVKLSSYFTGKGVVEWCEYNYDFGDDWTHDVKLIAVHTDKALFKRRLLGGERSAPKEDSGGVPGYGRMAHFVATGEDVYGDDPKELALWLGDWHPDRFDLATAKVGFDR